MYNYKIHNDKKEDIHCVIVGNDNKHKTKTMILTYNKDDKEISIQLSPTKKEKENSIEWSIASSEYMPFITSCNVYMKKKLVESIEDTHGIHISKCGNTIFIIASNIEIET